MAQTTQQEQEQINLNRWVAKRWKTYKPYFNNNDNDKVEDLFTDVNEVHKEITKQFIARNEYISWKNQSKK